VCQKVHKRSREVGSAGEGGGMSNTAKWSDEMRAQLLLKYKDKIDSLGEEEFFRQFDQIREECHTEIEGDKMTQTDIDLRIEYFSEFLLEADTDNPNPNTMYQIAEHVYSLTFPHRSLKAFARAWGNLNAIEAGDEPPYLLGPLVAFGGYRCGCTDLELDMASIPPYCPHHDKPLSNNPEWVENVNDVPLGFEIYTEVQERQMLIGFIVDSVTEDEPASKSVSKRNKAKSIDDSTLDMEDI
jgi:hypothetical protein